MKYVLITGAARGIGLELTRQYLEAGDSVVATVRNPDSCITLLTLKNDYSSRLTILPLDVTQPDQIERLVSSLDQPVDVLIHNAGVYGPKAERGEGLEEFMPGLDSVDKQAWQSVFEINTIAPMMLTRALLGSIEQSNEKKVLFISSMLGSIEGNNLGGGYIYNSSKAALNMVGKSLSVDLMNRGVKIAMAHPGWVKTDMGGPNAEITVKESAEGLRAILNRKSTPAELGGW